MRWIADDNQCVPGFLAHQRDELLCVRKAISRVKLEGDRHPRHVARLAEFRTPDQVGRWCGHTLREPGQHDRRLIAVIVVAEGAQRTVAIVAAQDHVRVGARGRLWGRIELVAGSRHYQRETRGHQ